MSEMRMSIAMCTYNGGEFISEQLESIASQSRLPNEVVLCDDGSTDNTISLLRTFADRKSFPVRIISNERRLGPAKNFEKAMSLCDGDIIVLSDQDDIWRPQKLEQLADAFDQNQDATYAFSDSDIIDDGGEPLGLTIWETVGLQRNLERFSGANQLRMLLKRNLIAGASLAFRASFRDIVLPVPTDWMHDYWIVVMGSALSRGVPIPERLQMYRRHPAQVCGFWSKTFRQGVRESMATDCPVLVGKVERFREVRRRIDLLCSAVECSQDRLELLKQKEAHLVRRAALRSLMAIDRAAAVLAEASTGRYQRFSDSWISIARDLIKGGTQADLN